MVFHLSAGEAFRACGLDVPRALVATGRFVSMVQGPVMKFNLNNPAFKVLPIDLPTTRRPIGAVSLKTRTLSPVARRFIGFAHAVAKGIPTRN